MFLREANFPVLLRKFALEDNLGPESFISIVATTVVYKSHRSCVGSYALPCVGRMWDCVYLVQSPLDVKTHLSLRKGLWRHR